MQKSMRLKYEPASVTATQRFSKGLEAMRREELALWSGGGDPGDAGETRDPGDAAETGAGWGPAWQKVVEVNPQTLNTQL